MSKVVKGIGKVFKKVGQIVKKIWKPLVIAAAIYFTAGAALAYFAPAAGAAGAAGAAAGAAGAAGAGAAAAGSAAAGGFFGTAVGATAAATATTATVGLAGLGGSLGTFAGAAASGGFFGTLGSYARTAWNMAIGKGGGAVAAAPGAVTPVVADMSGIERLMMVQTVISAASGLTAPKPPTPNEQAQASARFRGSYFGVDEKDRTGFNAGQEYANIMAPRAGETYRGAIPDRGLLAPQTTPPPTTAAVTPQPAASPASGRRPAQATNQTNKTSFMQPEPDNANAIASGATGQQPGSFYSPDDFYG